MFNLTCHEWEILRRSYVEHESIRMASLGRFRDLITILFRARDLEIFAERKNRAERREGAKKKKQQIPRTKETER